MIRCSARLVNVFSDPLKGFSGKGSARNCFELILKLRLPTQKTTSLLLTELPAVLQPRRASQLPPGGKIHSGPFHHLEWQLQVLENHWESNWVCHISFPGATHFNTTSKCITYRCHKNIQSGRKKTREVKQHSSFFPMFHGKQFLCAPHLQLHCRGAEKASTSILSSAGCCGTPGINLCCLLGWHRSLCPTVTSVPAHGSRRWCQTWSTLLRAPAAPAPAMDGAGMQDARISFSLTWVPAGSLQWPSPLQ